MKYLRLPYSFVVFIILLNSCQEDIYQEDIKWEENLLIVEARKFYEEVITKAQENNKLRRDRLITRGEITALWNKSYIKRDEKYEYVFVPIHASVKYLRFHVINHQEKKFEKIYLSQVLCVRKNNKGEHSMAIVTLNPNREYYNKNKANVAEKAIWNESLYGDFSGYVTYSNVVTGTMLTIDKVENGVIEWWVNRNAEKEMFRNADREALRGIVFTTNE